MGDARGRGPAAAPIPIPVRGLRDRSPRDVPSAWPVPWFGPSVGAREGASPVIASTQRPEGKSPRLGPAVEEETRRDVNQARGSAFRPSATDPQPVLSVEAKQRLTVWGPMSITFLHTPRDHSEPRHGRWMGTESCRWDPVRAFNRMVPALLRAQHEHARCLAPSAADRRLGKHVYLPRSGSGPALDAPPRTHRALQIGSGGSGDLEHAPAPV